MKGILIIITTSLLNIIKSAFWAALFSAFFCLIKWLGGLVFNWSAVTWGDFWGGGLVLFLVFFGHRMFWIIRDMRRRKKDPTYDLMANQTGISYDDYMKLKNK